MKTKEIKVSELSGSALDWCVALAYYGESKTKNGQAWFRFEKTGHIFYHTHENGWRDSQMQWFHPSTDWAQGGPIIERIRGLYVKHWVESSYDTRYEVHIHNSEEDCIGFGESLLIAAMRCYIASKLGDNVSVPVELLEV